jgi:hypothetical protein
VSSPAQICLSFDDKFVMVADEDGGICIFDVRPGDVPATRGKVLVSRTSGTIYRGISALGRDLSGPRRGGV